MITLDNLKPHVGAKKNKKRLGRGKASGQGKTAGKGMKGQKARSGGGVRPGFEGGQMPIYRQLPKRGFKNPFRKIYGIINISALSEIEIEEKIDMALLKDMGLIGKRYTLLKILGDGDINKPVHVVAHAVSKTAKQKIESAGGSVEIIPEKSKKEAGDKA